MPSPRLDILRSLPALLFIVLISAPLFAQIAPSDASPGASSPTPPDQNQPAASQPAPAPVTPAQPAPLSGTPKIQNGTSNDRLLFALPNFQTVEDAGKLPPLTAGQKYKLVVRGAFDWVQFPWYAMLAGIGQAENSEPSYGQGGVGYAKRYATNFGDGVIENFMVGAIWPSFLHQDPRFYQTSQGTVLHRLGYAMSRIVITRSDSGNAQFNYSELLGSTMTATLASYAYHPRDDRKLSNIASVWATQVGYDTLTYVTREFWPDLRRKLLRNKGNTGAKAGAASTAVQ